MDTPTHPDSSVINALGGTCAVAKLCEVRPPSVSKWRIQGIPKARRMYLRLVRPEAFRPESPSQEPGENPYPTSTNEMEAAHG